MLVYMPRFLSTGLDANLERLSSDCAEADAAGCQLAVFPEVFLTGYRLSADPVRLRAVFSALSALHPEMLICFGTFTEERRNRMAAYFGGRSIAEYDKVHLFKPTGEDELWDPGSRYVAFRHGEWRIGMVICNDIRFSEQAHALRQSCAVNMLVVPALWPWQRDHVWAALLRARAIEGGSFVLGCCVAGVDNGLERFDGAGNYIFDPLGNPVLPQGRVYEIDPAAFGRLTVNTREQYREVTDVLLL